MLPYSHDLSILLGTYLRRELQIPSFNLAARRDKRSFKPRGHLPGAVGGDYGVRNSLPVGLASRIPPGPPPPLCVTWVVVRPGGENSNECELSGARIGVTAAVGNGVHELFWFSPTQCFRREELGR